MKRDRERDMEWTQIVNNILSLEECGLVNTGNFRQDYFDAMTRLIEKVRKTSFVENPTDENKEELKENLYLLGNMFFTFRFKMAKYYKNTYDTNLPQIKETDYDLGIKNVGIPGAHNFIAYLNKITPDLFKNYYLKEVEVIEYFIQHNGVLPEFLYDVWRNKETKEMEIFLHELITFEKLPKELQEKGKDFFELPMYYIIDDTNYNEEEYKNRILSYINKKEERKKEFLEKELPLTTFAAKRKRVID